VIITFPWFECVIFVAGKLISRKFVEIIHILWKLLKTRF